MSNNFSAKLTANALNALKGVPPGYKTRFVSVAIEIILPLIKDCTISLLNDPDKLKEYIKSKLAGDIGTKEESVKKEDKGNTFGNLKEIF